MTDILQRKGDDAQIMKEEVVKIARSFDEEVMRFLLDWKGNEVQITEGVVTLAVGNELRKKVGKPKRYKAIGAEVMGLLLDRKGNEVQIAEGAVTAAAENEWEGAEVMRLLLDRKGSEVRITEEAVVQIAKLFDQKMMRLLLDRKENNVHN